MVCETENLNCNYLQEESLSNNVGEWKISDGLREFFVKRGLLVVSTWIATLVPPRTFPSETFTRRCNKSLFYRDQLNGEKFQRNWLCCSVESGSCIAQSACYFQHQTQNWLFRLEACSQRFTSP